jgi:hypothetical protein
VFGWQQAEYTQMGIWPGEAQFQRRYAHVYAQYRDDTPEQS